MTVLTRGYCASTKDNIVGPHIMAFGTSNMVLIPKTNPLSSFRYIHWYFAQTGQRSSGCVDIQVRRDRWHDLQ